MDYELVDTEYTPYVATTTVSDPEAVRDIKNKNLPPIITNYAIEIYYKLENTQVTKILKKKRRYRKIFVCIYNAYVIAGYPMDPRHLLALLPEFGDLQIDKAFNENLYKIEIDPILLCKFYIDRLNEVNTKNELIVDEIINELKEIYDICVSSPAGKDYIENSPVKTISIGILYFYLYINGMADIYKNNVSIAWYLSSNCIKKYYNNISFIYNIVNTQNHEPTVWYNEMTVYN